MRSKYTRAEIARARSAWKTAETLPEMCELMARFIEGSSPFIPGYLATTVATETVPLVPYLAHFNRCGALTRCSQPGLIDGKHEQRAFIDCLTDEACARRMAKVADKPGLLVQVYAPDLPDHVGARVNVTRIGDEECTWTGNCNFSYERHCFRRQLNAKAFGVLRGLWSVHIIDLKYGRNDLLWPSLVEALRKGKIGKMR